MPGARCARTTAPSGTAWDYFPHDHARSRAYRWNEDGLAGICDRHQRICFALALWNEQRCDSQGAALRAHRQRRQSRRGRQGVLLLSGLHTDPLLHAVAIQISPARRFPTPSSSRRTGVAGVQAPEFELIDTGVFEGDRYFDVFAEYAKGGPDDLAIRITVHNRGPEAARLQVLPTVWFRNTLVVERDGGQAGSAPGVVSSGRFGYRARGAAVWPPVSVLRRPAQRPLHRERDQHSAAVRQRRARAIQGRHQRRGRQRTG